MFFENLSIPRKLGLSFATLIAMFLLVSGLIFMNVAALRDVAAARDDARFVSDRMNDALTGVVEAQSAIRGFVLLGKPEFLATYEESKGAIIAAVSDARPRTHSDEQKRRFDDFTSAVREWQDTKIARTIALYHDPATRTQSLEQAGVKQLGVIRKIKKSIDEDQAALLAGLSKQRDRAEYRVTLALVFGAVMAVAVAGYLGRLLAKAIARPAVDLSETMKFLAEGKTDLVVRFTDRDDEIGSMARAVLVFRDAAVAKAAADEEQQRVMADVGGGLARLAHADLQVRFSAFPPSYAQLQHDFNHAMDGISGVIGSVATATRGITDAASDIRQASDDLSQRTEQQAASLEETAAAMDEITSTVRQTAAGAIRANSVAEDARVEAERSGDVVRRAVQAMSDIEQSSNEISEIISVIDGIAFQTNLLALNAGVEAARAGDAGRGFAVVASEVRALAQRSADAAKDVKTRITASAQQVDTGVELVSETGKALSRIIARIAELNTLVGQIAVAAEQQATGLQQVNTAVSEMDGVTQQNAAMVEESTAAARSLAAEADELARHVARFKLDTYEAQDVPSSASGRSVVHQLQHRAADAGRHIARNARRSGSAAVASATGDWSEF